MPRRLEGEFDYIVVGAARRAASSPTGSRPIQESRPDPGAGGDDNWIWFTSVGYLFAIGNPRSDWMFKTEAERA